MHAPELFAKCSEVQIDEPELFKAGSAVCRGLGTVIVQPVATDGLPTATALQFGAAPLRHVSGMPLTTFGWRAKLWRRFPFPVRELCSDPLHGLWSVPKSLTWVLHMPQFEFVIIAWCKPLSAIPRVRTFNQGNRL